MLLALLMLACGSQDERGALDSADGDVTWHGDVAPLVAEHCARCHQEGGLGPFDLTDPAMAVTLATSMLASIDAGTMPPPVSDPDCRDYVGSDDLTISNEERDLVAAWIDAGTPLGTPVPAPQAPAASLDDANLVLMMNADYTPSYDDSDNPDNEYRCFVMDPQLSEGVWLTGMHPIVGTPEIVHHVVLFAADREDVTGDILDGDGMDCIDGGGSTDGMIAGWAPGALPLDLGDAGIYLAPDQVLVLQMHYYWPGPQATGMSDRSGYAFRTQKEKPASPLYMAPLGSHDFVIPAGDADYTFEESLANEYVPLSVHAMFPHLHLLGTRYEARVNHADGTSTCLVRGSWDFNNQLTFKFQEPVQFGVGDTIEYSCTWDNSPGNDNQVHDPPVDVAYGERTDEEMCYFFSLVGLGS